MKVVWDLDGVLRDLSGYIVKKYGGAYPQKWDYICGTGKNIYETINADLDILRDSPPTAYCKVVKGHYPTPEIWTSQPKLWRKNTIAWISKYLGCDTEIRFLKGEEKEALLYSEKDTVLVEDSPNFENYDRILLIDRPYNQNVKKVVRIYGTKHLNNMLEVIKEA